MQPWFGPWLLLAAILAVLAWFDRRFLTLPWVFGALSAALLSALGTPPIWQWAALVTVSGGVLVGIARFRAPGRRSRGRDGRQRTRGDDAA